MPPWLVRLWFFVVLLVVFTSFLAFSLLTLILPLKDNLSFLYFWFIVFQINTKNYRKQLKTDKSRYYHWYKIKISIGWIFVKFYVSFNNIKAKSIDEELFKVTILKILFQPNLRVDMLLNLIMFMMLRMMRQSYKNMNDTDYSTVKVEKEVNKLTCSFS